MARIGCVRAAPLPVPPQALVLSLTHAALWVTGEGDATFFGRTVLDRPTRSLSGEGPERRGPPYVDLFGGQVGGFDPLRVLADIPITVLNSAAAGTRMMINMVKAMTTSRMAKPSAVPRSGALYRGAVGRAPGCDDVRGKGVNGLRSPHVCDIGLAAGPVEPRFPF